MSDSKKRVVVKTYPYEKSARAIFRILRDGSYHTSKGRPDEPPFTTYTQSSDEELADYVDENGNPDKKAQERYKMKKRKIVLEQFGALKILGFTKIKSRTTSATYALSAYGIAAVQGIAIIEEARKRNMSFKDVWNRLFDNNPPDIVG